MQLFNILLFRKTNLVYWVLGLASSMDFVGLGARGYHQVIIEPEPDEHLSIRYKSRGRRQWREKSVPLKSLLF